MTERPWTEERVDLLRSLIAAGHPYRYIASVLGTTKNAVIGKAHRLDIFSGKPTPKPYTKADLDDLKAALASGLDLRSISAAMDRTFESIKHKIEALGLDKPARKYPSVASRAVQSEGARKTKAPHASQTERAVIPPREGQFVTRPAGPPRPQHRVRPVVDGSIQFVDRASSQCAFILGDHRQLPAMCCGKDVRWGRDGTPTSWCPSHFALVYTPARTAQEPSNESLRMQARAFG